MAQGQGVESRPRALDLSASSRILNDSMLLSFVILYLTLSIGIGLFAATRVHNTKDFAVAGRSLPLPVVTATVFATWFGAEAVLGISATFVKDGLRAVVADPFGSSLCLILAGLLFARRLYRLNLLTIGDYYRLRYNRAVEILCTLCIVASYLGWVSAQIKALGLVFNIVTDGAMSQPTGMVVGALIVLTYTTFGGMFSVAVRIQFSSLKVLYMSGYSDNTPLTGDESSGQTGFLQKPFSPEDLIRRVHEILHAGTPA